jgi:hypothetical protein
MAHPPFDRSRIRFRPLAERRSKFRIDDIAVDPDGPVPPAGAAAAGLDETAREVALARKRGAPVILCHGAHLIKNGLGPLLARLVREGWITHVATNGAGSIHDWEFAYLGRSTEDVRAYVAVGEFGIWEETGRLLGLALHLGAFDGIGYGGAVGRLVAEERLVIPSREELRSAARRALDGDLPHEQGSAAIDLLQAIESGACPEGTVSVPHPWKGRSIQCACSETGVHFTVHPGIGQDIVYSHPLFRGGPVGRASITDFLLFAAAIERLEGGVYLSVGSSVMSPMIFEKSLSMARNVLLRAGRKLDEFLIVANDLVASDWDWSRGEPPIEDPAYYVRFLKTFSRMGGRFRYAGMDNRVFLLNLYARLRGA